MDTSKSIKKFLDKLGITIPEAVGLLFGLIVVFLISIPDYNTTDTVTKVRWFKKITENVDHPIKIKENLMFTTLISFFLVGFMFVRNIIIFKNKNHVGRLISIVVNVSMFSFILALFWTFLNMKSNIFVVGLVVMVVTLLLGQRNIARLSIIISIVLMFYEAVMTMSEVMGYKGYFLVIFFFISLYLQENVNFEELTNEFSVLYSTSMKSIEATVAGSADEIEHTGKVIGSTIKSGLSSYGIPLTGTNAAPVERQIEDKRTEIDN